MSSGSPSLSLSKSKSVIERNSKIDLKSESKLRDLDIKKDVENTDIKLQPFVSPTTPKYPSPTTTDQLHHYARSLVMVQR